MSEESLKAAYFDGIFACDDDPWDLASSQYEAGKFAHTYDVLAGRHYAKALEIGCAHGVLTGRLAPLCDRLLAIDICKGALEKARIRLGETSRVTLRHMAFPEEKPRDKSFDLVILSEVAYYWSLKDLQRAGQWLSDHMAHGGRLILVHYIGRTDYPHHGDEAVEFLRAELGDRFVVEGAERREKYRLDLWERQ